MLGALKRPEAKPCNGSTDSDDCAAGCKKSIQLFSESCAKKAT